MSKRLRIGELLTNTNRITASQLDAALAEQKRSGRPLGSTLVHMGFIGEGDLVEALARQLSLPVVRLDGKRLEPDVLKLIPVKLAQKYRCLPLFTKGEGGASVLYVGMEYPSDLAAVDDLSFHAGMEIQPVLVSASELHEAIDRYYRPRWEEGDPSDDPDDTMSELQEPESAPAREEPVPAAGAAPEPVAEVVEALASLLVEKRVITREELAARLRSASDSATRSR